MNIRKDIDYSELFAALDKVMAAGLPQMEQYCEIGRLICTRTEKGAAVAMAEYITEHYPEMTGFSPRNVRRMRDFYSLYTERADLLQKAMQLGWTQNVVILESDLTLEECGWYLQAAARHGWSKTQLQKQIENAAHLQAVLDKDGDMCYTVQMEGNTPSAALETQPIPDSTEPSGETPSPVTTSYINTEQHCKPDDAMLFCQGLQCSSCVAEKACIERVYSMSMKKILEHQVPFPVDAESDNFTAALASALVIARGYTDETPYWCARNNRYCSHCSSRGDDLLARHQLSIYHCLLTASTLAFGFDYPWDDTVNPHSLPGFGGGWRWDDSFVGALARFAGFTYLRFDGTSAQEVMLSTMKRSLDAGFPALLRLENELEWILAVGYDADTVYGLDSRFHALPGNWHSTLRDAIVITGSTVPDMSYKELLERIAVALSYDGHTALESVIMDALDHVTAENAMDTAGMMCGINGVPIEARWHAAESFCETGNLLYSICTDKEIHSRLSDTFFARYIQDGNDETHGLGWKIWGALGVGPETGYSITQQSADLILQKETQETLKRLFAKIFENDRAVCAEIQACLKQL